MYLLPCRRYTLVLGLVILTAVLVVEPSVFLIVWWSFVATIQKILILWSAWGKFKLWGTTTDCRLFYFINMSLYVLSFFVAFFKSCPSRCFKPISFGFFLAALESGFGLQSFVTQQYVFYYFCVFVTSQPEHNLKVLYHVSPSEWNFYDSDWFHFLLHLYHLVGHQLFELLLLWYFWHIILNRIWSFFFGVNKSLIVLICWLKFHLFIHF